MIYIVGIEPIDTRYTGHWAKYMPTQINNATGQPVTQLMGEILDTKLTEGAFFNFNSTIHFKNTQNNLIVGLFNDGKVKDGDYFLVTDAWNATAHQIRYMADLAGISIKIGGIWHAGSYDPNDFLGRQFKDKEWSFALEKSLYLLYDHNFFATKYHLELFKDTVLEGEEPTKSFRIGFPMEYYRSEIANELYFDPSIKEDLVLFPHRISSEKRPELFKAVRDICVQRNPNIKFEICQEKELTKAEYHDLVRRSKIIFSANKQETLGIGLYEGLICGAVPMAPDDLSYSEMYGQEFLYDKALIDDPESLADLIESHIDFYNSYTPYLEQNIKYVSDTFFTGSRLYDILRS